MWVQEWDKNIILIALALKFNWVNDQTNDFFAENALGGFSL